ncbi:acetylxylan esterase [Pontiella sp.]|uniref:acetylxylan esterase n=1 Tax=Pontiella sp. TaxID=2837462 RepID=UPI003567D37D
MALGFDLAREELETYRGTNPRPDDFDRYWKEALAEMRTVDPQIEIEPDPDFQVPFATCSHLWFTGVGGARIHAKLLQPKAAVEPHPAALQFHGYMHYSGDWAEKLNYVAAGFTVAALDCRGQGGLSEDVGGVKGTTMFGQIVRGLSDGPEKLLYRSIFLDTAQLARIVLAMPDVDETRVGTMGGSQGGALALVCAALEPRIRRCAPIHPFLCDYQRVWEMEQAKDAYHELRDFFRRHDPRHENEAEIFRRLGYIDVQHFASRIRAEVLMASSFDDTVCPPSTQFAAYNKIEAEKSMVIFPDYGHEWLPGFLDDTFRFMLAM